MKWQITPLVLSICLCLSASLAWAQEANCGNGIDDDGDGLIDCYDTDCGGTNDCAAFYFGVPAPSCTYVPEADADTFLLELVWQSDNTQYPIDQRHIPVVADIDNDDVPEVVVKAPGNTGYIRIFNGIDGSHERSITVAEGLSNFSNLAVADVDGDGTGEIFVVNDNSNLARYEHDGTNTWINSSESLPGADNSPAIADFDGDGNAEVYVANRIFNANNGTLLVKVSSASTGGYNDAESYPVAIDVFTSSETIPATGLACGPACDGLELVTGDTVYAVDLTQADGLTPASYLESSLGDGVVSVADFDHNDTLDAVIMNAGTVYIWNLKTGAQLYTSYDLPSYPDAFGSGGASPGGTNGGGRCNIADFDNDGRMEIGVAGDNVYTVLDTNASMQLVAKWEVQVDDASQRTGSTVFDFEGDGQNEVVYSEEEYLYIFDGATGEEKAKVVSRSGTRYDYPLVADVNADGQAEIVITSQDGNGPGASGNDYVRVYRSANTPWVAAREVWNQHTFFNTNINDNLTVPIEQQNHHLVPSLNGFLTQSTIRLASGSPAYASPDAQMQVLGIDDTKCVQDTLGFLVRVSNAGDGKLPAGAPVAFYLGNPRVAGAQYMDETTLPHTIDANSSEEVTLEAAFDPAALPADIYLVVNDTGFTSLPLSLQHDFPVTGVGECTYLDNISYVTVDVGCVASSDNDGDDIADLNDRDDDNDGIPDMAEDGGTGLDPSGDEDSDGIANYKDDDDATGGFPAWSDANSDGVNDVFDSDSDGVPDVFDLDSDADGIPDLVEAGGKDEDGNGMVDGFSLSTDPTSLTDTDSDGYWDTYDDVGGSYTGGTPLALPDTDGDGIDDPWDRDSDNDGLPDVMEQGGVDTDGDGLFDAAADEDLDGWADALDPDDDGTFGPDGGEAAQSLILTTGDDGMGRPTGYTGRDADLDGVLNHHDLDADNDGIADMVEAGGTDGDGDGTLDVATDTDGDGYTNTFDADNGGTAIMVTGADVDEDGRPDTYPTAEDADSDGLVNAWDLDADDDGLLDQMEAMTSAAYVAAGTSDSDADGILDDFEPTFLNPIDTDADGTDDYLDADSDADGLEDRHEAWDAYDDGDVVSDLSCTQDADADGLLDCYDSDDGNAAVRSLGATPPEDNGFDGTGYTASQTSTGSKPNLIFPNNGGSVDEPDWRDSGCTLSPDLYYPITGTDHVYNDGTDDHVPSVATTGSIRGTDFCVGFIEAGYHYYFNPMNPEQIMFSIEHGSNTTMIDYVELRRGLASSRYVDDGTHGFFVMARDWFVKTIDNAALTAPVNVRFYFDPADSTAMETAAQNFATATAGGKSDPVWFKVDTQWQTDDISTENGLSHLPGYTTLTPASYGTEDGLHYVQFNHVSSFSGGGLIVEVDQGLPVEFGTFDVRHMGTHVHLAWSTLHESNSSHFEVQRAGDDQHFVSIGAVPAQGYSLDLKEYEFRDQTPASGRSYYRIKQLDLDGSFMLSEVRAVNYLQDQLLAYPNPSRESLTVLLPVQTEQPALLRIIDPHGREVYRAALPSGTAVHRLTWGHDVPPGVYLVSVLQGEHLHELKLMKR